MKLAIIGAGAAGTAAAWSASRAGAAVTVFAHTAGATELYSGALDAAGWQEQHAVGPDAGVMAFCTALSAWSLGARPRRVATDAGIIRAARGIDTALLDLEKAAGLTVKIVDAALLSWDGVALGRALSAQPWAQSTGTRFEAVEVEGLVTSSEARMPLYDLAARFEDPAHLDRLSSVLAGYRAQAWLLGPWLGTRPGVAERLRERLGVPCGEVAAGHDSPAGARFAAAREELLSDLNVEVVRGRVAAVRPKGDRRGPEGVDVTLQDGGTSAFDGAVLAIGGVLAGGILLDDPHRTGAPGFRLALEAPARLELDGAVRDGFSSVHGGDLQRLGLSALERVGLSVDSSYAVASPVVYAAGDVVAGRPRTVLEAVSAGITAAGSVTRASRR